MAHEMNDRTIGKKGTASIAAEWDVLLGHIGGDNPEKKKCLIEARSRPPGSMERDNPIVVYKDSADYSAIFIAAKAVSDSFRLPATSEKATQSYARKLSEKDDTSNFHVEIFAGATYYRIRIYQHEQPEAYAAAGRLWAVLERELSPEQRYRVEMKK